nr:hypothetical protein [Tanacetum cinerariifolium]
MLVCTLCKRGEESHNHLFFKCRFSKEIWTDIYKRLKMNFNQNDWESVIEEFVAKPNANFIWSIVRRLAMGAAVYFIWKERNLLRIFVVQNNRWPCIMSSMMKEKQEKDKIETKPDKNGKRGKAQQCQRPIAVEKAEKRGNTDSRDQF